MTSTRSILVLVIGLVVGVVGALSAPLAFSVGSVGLPGSSATKAAAKPKTSFAVCVTKKRVVRGAGRFGACPRGTNRKHVSIRGPQGKPGPGANAINLTTAPSATTFVVLGAGISFGCRAGTNHLVLGLATSTSVSRGMTIRDNGADTDSQPWTTHLTRNGDTFLIGEFTGRNSPAEAIAHLSVATRWTGTACEVIGTLTPTS